MISNILLSRTVHVFYTLSIIGHAVAYPFAQANIPLVARANSMVLDPIANYNGIGSTPNAELRDWDNFYWSNGDIVGNLSCTAGVNRKMLNVARMGNDVTKMDCSKPGTLTMTFKDQAALQSAQADWTWLDNTNQNAVVLVADGGICGGSNSRSEYEFSQVNYDINSLTATMPVTTTTWDNFIKDYKLNVTSRGFGGSSTGLSKRADGSLDLTQDFSKSIASRNIGPVNLAVNCAHCGTIGSIDFSLSLSTSGITGSAQTKNGLGVMLGLGLTASGQLTDPVDLGSVQLLNLPLSPIEILSVASFSPVLTASVSTSIAPVTAAITADFGVALVIPDGTTIRFGNDSDPFSPRFNKIGPTLSAPVQVSATLTPAIALSIGVMGPVIAGAVAGIAFNAPSLDSNLTATASAGGVCGQADAIAGVQLEVNVSADLKSFAGLGSATDEPNARDIFQTSTPVFNDCVVVTKAGGSAGIN